jgi:hypothetical protein
MLGVRKNRPDPFILPAYFSGHGHRHLHMLKSDFIFVLPTTVYVVGVGVRTLLLMVPFTSIRGKGHLVQSCFGSNWKRDLKGPSNGGKIIDRRFRRFIEVRPL